MRQNYKDMGFAAINRFFISPSPVVLVWTFSSVLHIGILEFAATKL